MRLLVVASIVLAASCAPRAPLFLSWTIDGFAAEQACQQLTDPTARVRSRVLGDGTVSSEATSDEATSDEVTRLACADGTPNGTEARASLTIAGAADIAVEILDGDVIYGASGTVSVDPDAARYPGQDAQEAISVDVRLERGRLRATLRVVGRSCAQVGADSFAVTLRRKGSPLGSEVVAEQTIACSSEGDAIFSFQPVAIGDHYDLVATTSIGGVAYTTDDGGGGEGVKIAGGLTDLVVDLDIVGRPDE